MCVCVCEQNLALNNPQLLICYLVSTIYSEVLYEQLISELNKSKSRKKKICVFDFGGGGGCLETFSRIVQLVFIRFKQW